MPSEQSEKVTRRFTIDDDFIDNQGYFEVIEPAWWIINIYDGVDAYRESMKNLSKGQIHLVTTIWHVSEVCNGGHCQFYTNSTGIVWPEALAGYRAIGLDELADILQEGADRFGGHLSLDRTERENQLDAGDDDLDDLDNRFFEIEKTGRIEEAMMKYIKDHRSEFYFDGEVLKYE
jgi:hypothetical protein